jgi:hypothetical protein
MKHLFIFEDFNNHSIKDLKVYHGGGYLDNHNIKACIFTTTDKQIAKEYIHLNSNDKFNFLTTLLVTINNPLSSQDFEKKWLPILDEINFKYDFEKHSDGSHSFEAKGIDYGNIFDLIYLPQFVETCLKYGYDGLIGDDIYFQSSIPVFIPLLKENILVISSEKLI